MSWGAIVALTGEKPTPPPRLNRNLARPPVSVASMSPIRIFACALAVMACAVAAAGETPALASHKQVTYFEGSNILLNPAKRPRALAQLRSRGVKALRVELYWRSVAPNPNGSAAPAFKATDPASYAWGQYDALLAEAQRLGWPVLLTLTSPVPRWATSNRRAPFVTRPGAKAFEESATAVAPHYGSPAARYSIWNAP